MRHLSDDQHLRRIKEFSSHIPSKLLGKSVADKLQNEFELTSNSLDRGRQLKTVSHEWAQYIDYHPYNLNPTMFDSLGNTYVLHLPDPLENRVLSASSDAEISPLTDELGNPVGATFMLNVGIDKTKQGKDQYVYSFDPINYVDEKLQLITLEDDYDRLIWIQTLMNVSKDIVKKDPDLRIPLNDDFSKLYIKKEELSLINEESIDHIVRFRG